MTIQKEQNFNRALGLRLMVLRQSKKISQEYLGTCIGVSGQQVQKYENGINRITPKKLALCAEILKVPIGYFYGENDESLESYNRSVLNVAADIHSLPEHIRRVMQHLARAIDKELR